MTQITLSYMRSKQILYSVSQKMSEKVWTEADFSDLYPVPPEIVTQLTYVHSQIQIGKDLLAVKLPGKGYRPEQCQYLLHREIYHYYLNCRDENPLVNTAVIIYLETDNWLDWYRLWLTGQQIPKNTVFKPVHYFGQCNLRKYSILARQKANKQVFLGRSRRDGEYYNIHILEHRKYSDRQSINIYLTQIKNMQHPFIEKLREVFQTNEKTYLVFDHAPLFLHLEDERNDSNPLSEEEFQTCLVEVLFALLFIQQRGLDMEQDFSDKIGISKSGHILLKNHPWAPASKNSPSDLPMAYNFIRFLLQFINCMMPGGSAEESSNLDLDDFINYIGCLSRDERATIKDFMNHSFISKIPSHQILSKSLPPIASLAPTKATQGNWIEVKPHRAETIYRQFERAEQFTEAYYNNQPYLTSAQAQLLSKWESECLTLQSLHSNSITKTKRSSDRSSRKSSEIELNRLRPLGSMHKKSLRTLQRTSPYEHVLKSVSTSGCRKLL